MFRQFVERIKTVTLLGIVSMLIVACQEPDVTATAVPTPTSSPTNTVKPTPTPSLPTITAQASPSPIPSPTPSPIPTSELIDGWLLYENEFYQYQFSYPPEAEISTAGVNSFPTGELPEGMTFDEYIAQLRQIYTDDICVRLQFEVGFVTIAAPPDKGSQYTGPCGVSGVGDYDVLEKTETVIIDGRPYTAEGWELRERDEDAAWRGEFFFLYLEDDTLINYGYSGRQIGEAAYEEYLATKEILLQIVTSFRSEAPALTLDDTVVLYSTTQDGNWALKAYPYRSAFTRDVFDRFYGPEARMEDVRRYTRFNFGPQLSPNGRYLLLPGVYGNNTGLWLVNLQTNEARRLLRQPKVATWSPYGDQIAYVDGDTLYTLSVAEGAVPQPIYTQPGLWGLFARWSPDGRAIATMTSLQGEPDETGGPELQNTYWLVSVYDHSAYELAQRADFAMEYISENMTWSPTGRYLLVRNQVFDLDGRQLSPRLTGGAHWLPVSKQLEAGEQEQLLVNGRDGLTIMTIEGEEVTPISDAFVDTWAFSHDGRSLAYLDPHNKTDLIIFDLDSQETQRLGPVPKNVLSLYWSGNDDYLLMDDSLHANPIWALSIQPGSQAQVIVEEGTLIAALPAPVKDVAPGTAVSIPTITPADLAPPEPPSSSQGPIVFFAHDDDLWRADVSGEQAEQLTEGGALDWGMTKPGDDWRIVALSVPPIVSPNGRWIAFPQDGRTLSIALVDVAVPGQLRQVSPGPLISAWSPDSGYLAYGAADSLFIYDVENDILNQQLGDTPAISNVVWSPDMRYLAFACCFERPDGYSTADFGEIRRVEIATGQVEIVDATKRTIGGGTPPICWDKAGRVNIRRGAETARCSFAFSAVGGRSPDGSQSASIFPASPDDDFWEGDSMLAVRQSDTNEIVWQRQISGHASRPRWSPDGAYVIFQRGAAWENNLSIWRILADGTAVPEQIINNGYLLDVIPQW